MDVLSHCWWFLGTKKWDGLDIFLLYLLVERVSCLLLLCFLFFSPFFRFIRLSEKNDISEVLFQQRGTDKLFFH